MEFSRIYPRILAYVQAKQSVMVFGPRGSGKTFYLTRLLREFSRVVHIDLLIEAEFERYTRNPGVVASEVAAQITAAGSDPVLFFFDEIQRVPPLLNEIHRLIEIYKSQAIFLLTGSSARKLRSANANLLAGRALTVNFFPLCIDEIPYSSASDPEILQFGLLPQVYAQGAIELKEAFLRSYVGTYLSEEIQREAQIRNLSGFARFLELAAVESGSLVNYSKIARAAGVSDHTIKGYFQILVDTLVGYLIPSWTYGIREQLRQAPKHLLFDTGVINALTGELGSEARPATNRFGRLFENFITTQLIHRLRRDDLPYSIFHYRDVADREIDLILQKNPYSPPVAIEIKSSPQPTLAEVPSLAFFQQTYPDSVCFVICRTPRPYTESLVTGQRIRFIPPQMLAEIFGIEA